MQKAIVSSTSQAQLDKNRNYLKYLVAHKENAAGVRPQVAGTMENNNAIAKPLRRSADLRGTTPYAPEVQAGFTFWSSNTPMYRRTNPICNDRGRFGSFHREQRRDPLKHISISYGE
jgi:hypothetical protein